MLRVFILLGGRAEISFGTALRVHVGDEFRMVMADPDQREQVRREIVAIQHGVLMDEQRDNLCKRFVAHSAVPLAPAFSALLFGAIRGIRSNNDVARAGRGRTIFSGIPNLEDSCGIAGQTISRR